VSLGQHLGPEQDTGFTAVRCIKHLLHGALASGAIAIDTQYFAVGKTLLQVGFAALGALASGNELLALAARALLGYKSLMITVVTD